ncbi:MAG: DUF6259 domain-containing protein, partial [Candidatus Hydrogenedentes bacterium]|nr:DUF6259 domain-containing protein [Candidatus Hydrogenedentota bacterium]
LTRVDLTGLFDEASGTPGLQVFEQHDVKPIPAQFVPDAEKHTAGTLIAQGSGPMRVVVGPPNQAPAALNNEEVSNPQFTMGFRAERTAGFPSSIQFASGKRFDTFSWNDRLYHHERGMFWTRYDRDVHPEVVSNGPLCTVVRVCARYCAQDGTPSPSGSAAVYDWYVFRDKPLVYVSAAVTQQTPMMWDELHFLELNFPDESFTRWAGGEPLREGAFSGTNQTAELGAWGALIEGKNAIAMIGGPLRCYDGRGGYGTYLHSTWNSNWDASQTRLNTWLWIGSADAPLDAIKAETERRSHPAKARITMPALDARMTTCSDLQRVAIAQRLEARMRWNDAERAVSGTLPEGWLRLAAGDLAMELEAAHGGIHVESLFDTRANQELLGEDVPLFRLELWKDGGETASVAADTGWKRVSIKGTEGATDAATLTWAEPSDARLAGLEVCATLKADAAHHAWRWTFEATADNDAWSLTDATFPQVAVQDLGPGTMALFPQGPGELNPDPFGHPMKFRDKYPTGWCGMQFTAVYGPATGLYFGMHDPFGGFKRVIMESHTDPRTIQLGFDHFVPDSRKPHNRFTLSGEAVWQLLRGDWFDAAQIYKEWVRGNAKWWPALTADGRADTPLWMRELCAWAQTAGTPADCVEKVKEFQRFLDVPIGFHWYCWHKIPFDNDYPHYFPTQDGVAEAVKSLQESNVYVMPYINGRLWDTRDKGAEDFEFTSVALPAVAKDENGKPYTETYASKESDGSPVRLGVMCPTTPLWQSTVKDIVLRLQREVGVMGVYIDQIAAAAPVACMDASHGHPLGGGHWWNEGYWKLLDGIRSNMAKDRMITTECNAEPYVKYLDGYLTWHWQYDHIVPVFPAIYGGAIQMFGRSYAAGPTADLALRMKAAQQLTFGEQIGWADPKLVLASPSAGFFRKAVQLRWRYRRYFYAGEMARPPKLGGDVPTVRADWQWSGECWVEMPAILTGAWRLPSENRLVLLFANVSEQPLSVPFNFDAATYGLGGNPVHVAVAREREGTTETFDLAGREQRTIALEPCSIIAWEITP